MNKEEHLEKLLKLQTELTETPFYPQNTYASTIIRPKLIKALGQEVEEARKIGITEKDVNELVAELEITTGRRPIELESFWDPRRLSKGWREKRGKHGPQ